MFVYFGIKNSPGTYWFPVIYANNDAYYPDENLTNGTTWLCNIPDGVSTVDMRYLVYDYYGDMLQSRDLYGVFITENRTHTYDWTNNQMVTSGEDSGGSTWLQVYGPYVISVARTTAISQNWVQVYGPYVISVARTTEISQNWVQVYGPYVISVGRSTAISGEWVPVGDTYTISIYSSGSTGALGIVTTSITSGQKGKVYSYTLQASGGTTPYTWSIVSGSLPTGLSLSTAGKISGTPTELATTGKSVTIKVTDANGDSITKSFSVIIQNAETSTEEERTNWPLIIGVGAGITAIGAFALIKNKDKNKPATSTAKGRTRNVVSTK